MGKKMWLALLAIGLVILIGAVVAILAPRNEPEKEPSPDEPFLDKVGDSPNSSFISRTFYREDKDICAVINQKPLWGEGDDPEQLSDQIISTLQLSVNGVSYPINEASEWGSYEPVEENGEVIGAVAGNITLCFSTIDLGIGSHVATITLENTSTQRFSYNFGFEVTSE